MTWLDMLSVEVVIKALKFDINFGHVRLNIIFETYVGRTMKLLFASNTQTLKSEINELSM